MVVKTKKNRCHLLFWTQKTVFYNFFSWSAWILFTKHVGEELRIYCWRDNRTLNSTFDSRYKKKLKLDMAQSLHRSHNLFWIVLPHDDDWLIYHKLELHFSVPLFRFLVWVWLFETTATTTATSTTTMPWEVTCFRLQRFFLLLWFLFLFGYLKLIRQ